MTHRRTSAGALLATAFAFLLLLPAAEEEGCDHGEVVIGEQAADECDECYAGCLARDGDEETCRAACASGGADGCLYRCRERGGDEEACREACYSDDCDECWLGCYERGGDEQSCRELCATGNSCRTACERA